MRQDDRDAIGPAVEVRGLRREYRPARRGAGRTAVALDGLDLVVPRGEVHGLLGPNGAGKTTLCKILSTVLLATGGTARVCGHDVAADPQAVRSLIGIVFGGDRGLYGRVSARQNLRLWGALHGLGGAELRRRVDELLERVGLAGRRDDRVDGFSRGMKQRLHLARGLVGDPEVVILDEPTTGMDPVAARDFRDLVGELRAERRTVLLTTHDMAEAEAVCDRVTLLDRGVVIAEGNPAALARELHTHLEVRAEGVSAPTTARVAAMPGVLRAALDGDGVFSATVAAEGAADVLRLLLGAGAAGVGTALPSLEDAYLRLVEDRGMMVGR
ncbi:hypothetical protein ACE1SV_65020 [Streptomyces sp. E-15]|uniref:ABC transporter ATP-binding protein n=1 Tax=Streptomyces sp. NPDC012751 TaxID=3364846 RepID=UPI0035D17A82